MGSIIKMLKGSKKHGNKENVPVVSFNTTSLKPSKPKLTDFVYDGEPSKHIDNRLKSPYAVLTAPKTTRGSRSCPGVPLEDYDCQNNTTMLSDRKNMMRMSGKEKKRNKADSVISHKRNSEFVDEMAYRNMMARRQYDISMNMCESDDDEVYEAKIRTAEARSMKLEEKMHRMNRRMSEERHTMSAQIEILQDENYHLKKSYDRLKRSYSEMKQKLEAERKRNEQNSEVWKMLHEANNKIAILEARNENENDESINTSSLLQAYPTELERSSDGAGEALCFPDGITMTTNKMSFGLFNTQRHDATMIVNTMPNSMNDDRDAQDEVRIFRKDECTDGGESSGNDIDTAMESPKMRKKEAVHRNSAITSGEITRSHSDTDLVSPHRNPRPLNQSIFPVDEKPRYSRTSSWIKRNPIPKDEEPSTSDSEEERLSLIDRQLKKKGGLVKYNPPRQTIQPKLYKRFGKMERNALAEFEYLQEMSTDVSGMMSSPDVNQMTMSHTFPPKTLKNHHI